MNKKGYHRYFGVKLIKEVLEDLFKNKNNSLKEKIWAYNRGFLSPKINEYGLTEENYKYYLSDFDYYRLYPINNRFKTWIDDKLTVKYILYPFNKFLPRYYYQLDDNKTTKLMDCDSNLTEDVDGIIRLLKKEKTLAIKLIAGSLGKDFYKIKYVDNGFYINEKQISEKEFKTFIKGLNNYVITEYITSHKEISKIYSKSPNAMRLIVINEDEGPQIIYAFIKFGTEESGVIEHVHAGGIMSEIDLENGCYSNPKSFKNGILIDCPVHPDTKVKIEGEIPYWDFIKEKTIEIGNYLPQLRYMGFDIVITNEGFKILEVNSHPGIGLIQAFKPLLMENPTKEFYQRLLNLH